VRAASSSILAPGADALTAAGNPVSTEASAPARLHGLERSGGLVHARLDLDGAERVLRFRFAGIEPDARYEPFVVAATPLAMRFGRPLEVAGPVSRRL
jgi:hypothetical protein